MKLQGKVNPEATVPVRIRDSFIVNVSPATRRLTQQIYRRNTRPKLDPRTREMGEETDPIGVFADTVAAHIKGWAGLTQDTALALLKLEQGVEIDVPEPDEHGHIPCDHERVVLTEQLPGNKTHGYTLPQLLWDSADADEFRDIITGTAADWERAEEARRAKKSET